MLSDKIIFIGVPEEEQNEIRRAVNTMEQNRADGVCAVCRGPVSLDSFRDELSKREFRISGLCQVCQDDVFGGGEE